MKIINYILKTILILSLINFVSCSSPSRKVNLEKKANAYYTKGTTDLMEKDYTSALKNLLQANKYRPKDSDTLNNLGMAYFFKKRSNTAKKYIYQSLKINPKNSDARNNLASIYFKEKKYDLAQKQYLKVREHLTYAHQYRVLYNMALIYKKKNLITKTINNLKLSIKDNSDYCPSHIQLGLIYSENGDFQKALDHFSNATKGPCYKYPAPSYLKAVTLFKLNQTFRSKALFRDIMARFPKTKYSQMAKQKLREIKESSYSQIDNPIRNYEEQQKIIHNGNISKKRSKILFSTPRF